VCDTCHFQIRDSTHICRSSNDGVRESNPFEQEKEINHAKSIQCFRCCFRAGTKKELAVHCLSRHNTIVPVFTCNHCGFEIINGTIAGHVCSRKSIATNDSASSVVQVEEVISSTKLEIGRVPLPCNMCDFSASTKMELDVHYTEIHHTTVLHDEQDSSSNFVHTRSHQDDVTTCDKCNLEIQNGSREGHVCNDSASIKEEVDLALYSRKTEIGTHLSYMATCDQCGMHLRSDEGHLCGGQNTDNELEVISSVQPEVIEQSSTSNMSIYQKKAPVELVSCDNCSFVAHGFTASHQCWGWNAGQSDSRGLINEPIQQNVELSETNDVDQTLVSTFVEEPKIVACNKCNFRAVSEQVLSLHNSLMHSIASEQNQESAPIMKINNSSQDVRVCMSKYDGGNDPCEQKVPLTPTDFGTDQHCYNCDFSATTQIELLLHISQKHMAIATLIRCDECGLEVTNNSLDGHVCLSNNPSPYDATSCEQEVKNFLSSPQLHSESESFHCYRCDFSASARSELELHCSERHYTTVDKEKPASGSGLGKKRTRPDDTVICDKCSLEITNTSLNGHVCNDSASIKEEVDQSISTSLPQLGANCNDLMTCDKCGLCLKNGSSHDCLVNITDTTMNELQVNSSEVIPQVQHGQIKQALSCHERQPNEKKRIKLVSCDNCSFVAYGFQALHTCLGWNAGLIDARSNINDEGSNINDARSNINDARSIINVVLQPKDNMGDVKPNVIDICGTESSNELHWGMFTRGKNADLSIGGEHPVSLGEYFGTNVEVKPENGIE
jgi:hypothetical protein